MPKIWGEGGVTLGFSVLYSPHGPRVPFRGDSGEKLRRIWRSDEQQNLTNWSFVSFRVNSWIVFPPDRPITIHETTRIDTKFLNDHF
jgi:hypothetical protein